MTDSPRRHWADHPRGVHADRQWRAEASSSTSYSDEEVYWTSDPPSDLLRAANMLPFKPYVYGGSSPSLRPKVDEAEVLRDISKPSKRRPPSRQKKPKPPPEPDTYVPPPSAPPPPDPGGPSPADLEKRRLERENRELKERLARLEAERPVPLFVKPFVCSSCDPASPLFTPTHGACPAGDCACYQQTPDLHDRNKRMEKQS